MPEDMRFPFEYDETGDVATVTGEDFYYRHALQLALIGAESAKGSPLTATDVVEIQDTIGETIIASPYIDPPVTVEVDETAGEEEFAAEVIVNDLTEFEITV